MAFTVDLTPTWGEWGNMLRRFVQSNEQKAIHTLWPDAAKCFAIAQACVKLDLLTPEAQEIIKVELAKQGMVVTEKGKVEWK